MTEPDRWPSRLAVDDHPFPHVVVHGLFGQVACQAARTEFDAVTSWQRYDNDREQKMAARFDAGGPTIRRIETALRSPRWIGLLERAFGIDGLTFDDLGGGLHRIPPGGFLDMHVDFNQHPDGRYRRINCLLFLNDDPHMTGDLVLGGKTGGRYIRPATDTLVAFVTRDDTWHGHPTPYQHHEDRRSLAAYYYTSEPPAEGVGPAHSTIFREA